MKPGDLVLYDEPPGRWDDASEPQRKYGVGLVLAVVEDVVDNRDYDKVTVMWSGPTAWKRIDELDAYRLERI